MDRAIATLIFLILAVIGGVLFAPSYIEWNTYKPQIEAYAEELIGRDVTIAGDIGFVMVPTPTLLLEDFVVANPPETGEGDMINLKRLEVIAALRTLLTGELQITNVNMVKPVISIEVLGGGQTNWQFDETNRAIPRIIKDRPWWLRAIADAMRLDNLTIEDGTMTYSDANTGAKNVLRDLNTTISAESVNGPFEAQGQANVRNADMAFIWSSGDTSQTRSVPLRVSMTLKPSDATLSFRGFMDEASLFGPLSGALTFEASNGNAGLNDLFSVIKGAPIAKPRGLTAKALSKDLLVETGLSITASEWTAADVAINLGGVRAKGNITGQLGSTPTFAAKLESRSINLDSLLEEKKGKSKSVDLSKAAQKIEKDLQGFVMPDMVKGTIDLAIDGIIYRAGVIENVKVKAKADKGEVQILSTKASLPGKSVVNAKGKWAPTAGGTKFSGTLDLKSESPRALASWLGVDGTQLPSSRLKSLSVLGQLTTGPNIFGLADAALELDGNTYKVNLGQDNWSKPAYVVHIDGKALDLDAYKVFVPERFRTVGWSGEGAGSVKLMPDDVNLDVNITLDDFKWNSIRYEAIDAEFSLVDGSLAVDHFDVSNVNGAKITLTGEGGGTLQSPNLAMTGKIETADLGTFLSMWETPGADYFGNTKAIISFDGSLDEDTGSLPFTVDLTGEERPPLSLAGLIGREAGQTGLTVSRKGKGSGQLEIKLTPGENEDGPYQIQITGEDETLGKGLANLGLDYQPSDPSLSPFVYNAQVILGDAEIGVENLNIVVGGMTLTGQGSIDRSSEIPKVTGSLVASQVNLDPLFPQEGGLDISTDISSEQDVEALRAALLQEESKAEENFLSWASQYDAELDFRAETFSVSGFDFKEVKAQMGVRDQVAFVENLTASAFDGSLGADFTYSAKDVLPEWKGTAKLEQAALTPFVVDLFGFAESDAPIAGEFDLEGSYSALGRSAQALLATLNGEVTVSAAQGAIKGINTKGLLEAVGKAKGLEEFGQMVAAQIGTSEASFENVTGTLIVDDGKVRTKSAAKNADMAELLSGLLTMDGDGEAPAAGQIQIAGEIDFNTDVMKGEGRVQLNGLKDAPPLKIRLNGPVLSPQRQIESAALGVFLCG